MDRSFQGLIVSLIIHGVLFWLLLHAQAPRIDLADDKTVIELVEDQDKNPKTFVPNTQEKDLHKELNEQADLLAELSKRVKKQMKARSGDKNVNGGFVQKRGQSAEASHDYELALPGQHLARTVAITPSSITANIPGIEEGAFTALNQQQFTYAPFFGRLSEQIGNRWRSGVRGFVSRLSNEDLQLLSKQNRETVLEVLLTSDGHFSKAYILKSSGHEQLDLLPFNAFRAAAPFLNPPKGLVDPDGLIRIRYAFFIQFRPPNFGPDIN